MFVVVFEWGFTEGALSCASEPTLSNLSSMQNNKPAHSVAQVVT
jgi:hypothetical protein